MTIGGITFGTGDLIAAAALILGLYATVRQTITDIRNRHRLVIEIEQVRPISRVVGEVSPWVNLEVTLRNLGGRVSVADIDLNWRESDDWPRGLGEYMKLDMNGSPTQAQAEANLGDGDIYRQKWLAAVDQGPGPGYRVRALVTLADGREKFSDVLQLVKPYDEVSWSRVGMPRVRAVRRI